MYWPIAAAAMLVQLVILPPSRICLTATPEALSAAEAICAVLDDITVASPAASATLAAWATSPRPCARQP